MYGNLENRRECFEMEYNEILEEIKAGLTGDVQKDVIYLMEKNEQYKKSPYAADISRETGKMIYNILPENEKAMFSHVLNEDSGDIRKKIENAEKYISEQDYLKALDILEGIIPNICDDERENSECDYVSLNSFFELCIYTEIYRKGRPVRPTPFEFSEVYRLYGFSLYKLMRDDEAEKAFEKAVYWNPVGVPCLLELAEMKYRKKSYKSFLKIIKDCLKYTYSIIELAVCYSNLGRYFYDKGDLDTSSAMYIVSDYFKPNEFVLKKLEGIAKEQNRKFKRLSSEEMKSICERNDISFGVNPEIIKLAAGVGTDAKRQGNIQAAKYCYDILFSLTGDKAVQDMIFNLMRKN